MVYLHPNPAGQFSYILTSKRKKNRKSFPKKNLYNLFSKSSKERFETISGKGVPNFRREGGCKLLRASDPIRQKKKTVIFIMVSG